MQDLDYLAAAIDAVGQTALAKACGVRQPTVHGWKKKGLPRTEWTGETDYSGAIERLSDGAYTKARLLNGERVTEAASSAGEAAA